MLENQLDPKHPYIDLHGKKAKEKEVLVDTAVQENNITFPIDSKQYHKVLTLLFSDDKNFSTVKNEPGAVVAFF